MYSQARYVAAYLLHGGLVSAESMAGEPVYLSGLEKDGDVVWAIFHKNPKVKGGVEILHKDKDLYAAVTAFLGGVWSATLKEEGLAPKVQRGPAPKSRQ
jgi:hypothetical protein